jgi:serine/threonine protein kinase
VTGIHKKSKLQVTINVYHKKDVNLALQNQLLLELRNQIQMHKLTSHLSGVVRLLDYFESKSNVYLCFEKLYDTVSLYRYVMEAKTKQMALKFKANLGEQRVKEVAKRICVTVDAMH